jgi:hypothetical protein
LEIIGLFFATAALFTLAVAVSAMLVGITWLCLPKIANRRKQLILAAVLIPLASAAYFWFCLALLPGQSLFADIDQPLPNGYSVPAMGKMPDFASISNTSKPNAATGMTQYIGRIAIDGQFVVGQYSHQFGEFKPTPPEPFFLFDTQLSKNTEFATLNELQSRLGHPITLTEVQYFKSPLATTRQTIDKAIEFGPPFLAIVFLAIAVWRSRSRIEAHAPNIYT